MTQVISGAPSTDLQHRAPKVRLKHLVTGKYLHLSAECTIKGTTYAWSGSKRQARTIRARAIARGEEWPFKAVKKIEAIG